MCCFQTRKCLGNILKSSLPEIWNSPLAKEIRQVTLNSELHPLCKIHSCPFNHMKSFEGTDTEVFEYPRQFEIDLPTQHCNIGGEKPDADHPACLMCERHTNFHPQIDRLEKVCESLKPYISHVNAVHIQGVAEPFWKNRIFQIIDMLGIEQYKHRIRISTTSNGTLFDDKKQADFLAFPQTTITFSLDAGKAATFKIIRRLDLYDKICERIKAYSAKRTPGQWLHIHNNINLINIQEVEAMVEFAAEAKVDLVDFNPTYCVPGICVTKDTVDLFHEAQEKIIQRANALGVKCSFMRDLTLDMSDKPWKHKFHLDESAGNTWTP
jgi:wyosine [tRNA(Phe)-imidazoG37] synthetase (radical SAM superfamily)